LAELYDSGGNDRFVGDPNVARLYNGGFSNRVAGFSQVKAYASDGYDQAFLYDAALEADYLEARVDSLGKWAEMSGAASDYANWVGEFDYVEAHGSSDPGDTKDVDAAVDFLVTYGIWA
jgi:hypothetical protein